MLIKQQEKNMLIFKQIPAIIKDIEAVEKSKRPGSQISYAYRSIDEFMNVLNPLLAKHKVTVVPEVLENNRDSYKTSSGSTMHSVVMKIKYTFYAEDGSNVCAIMIGESFDSGDKASNKAQSVALKYAIMQVFMVPTEDIEDPDHHDTSKNIKPIASKPLVNHAPIGVNHITADRENGMKFGKSTKTVSEAQLKRLDAIAYKAGWAFGDIITECKARFNCDTGSLNMNQYDELCTYIQSNKPKEESMPF